MKGLLYKDFLLSKAMLIVLGVITAIIFIEYIIGAANAVILMFMAFFLTGIMNCEIFRKDENAAWCCFAASSPVSFRGQVGSKYIFLLLENIVILSGFFITDAIAVLAAGDTSYSAIIPVFMIFCWRILMNAVEIPFLIRFGSDKGLNIKVGVIGTVLAIAGIYMLYGDISFLDSPDPIGELIKLFSTEKLIWVYALFPFVSCGAYYLSYRISLALYRKGCESYEQ